MKLFRKYTIYDDLIAIHIVDFFVFKTRSLFSFSKSEDVYELPGLGFSIATDVDNPLLLGITFDRNFYSLVIFSVREDRLISG